MLFPLCYYVVAFKYLEDTDHMDNLWTQLFLKEKFWIGKSRNDITQFSVISDTASVKKRKKTPDV